MIFRGTFVSKNQNIGQLCRITILLVYQNHLEFQINNKSWKKEGRKRWYWLKKTISQNLIWMHAEIITSKFWSRKYYLKKWVNKNLKLKTIWEDTSNCSWRLQKCQMWILWKIIYSSWFPEQTHENYSLRSQRFQMWLLW